MSASNATARLVKARTELREWLADLSMLEKRADVVDTGSASRAAFNRAWIAALAEGAKAATEYADAIGEAANGV